MLKQIKKMPYYILKFLQNGSVRESIQIVKEVGLEHVLIALAARLDRKSCAVRIKKDGLHQEINQYIELLKYRKERMEKDIYLWDFGDKQVYCNYLQLLGLQQEYLADVFNDIYRFNWKGKTVVDIGGFVGDTALYFLSKGAKKVVVYEPVPKNVTALNYNLEGLEKHFECHQKALSAISGPAQLCSNEPACSNGFGMTKGEYTIKCAGISISDLLKKHPMVDVMKVDCEGGEVHLLEMDHKEIRSVPFWIIETHSHELLHAISQKFKENGFSCSYEKALTESVSVLHFTHDCVQIGSHSSDS